MAPRAPITFNSLGESVRRDFRCGSLAAAEQSAFAMSALPPKADPLRNFVQGQLASEERPPKTPLIDLRSPRGLSCSSAVRCWPIKRRLLSKKGGFVRTRVRVSPITPEQLKQKQKKSKPTKRKSARRPVKFKSDSWYSNAMLSIGVSAKAESTTY